MPGGVPVLRLVLAASVCFASELAVDVLIPLGPSDVAVVARAVRGARRHVAGLRRVYIVAPAALKGGLSIVVSDGGGEAVKLDGEPIHWVDEEPLLERVARMQTGWQDRLGAAGEGEGGDTQGHPRAPALPGWVAQQVLKLYAPLLIPGIGEDVLVMDADVLWMKDVAFTATSFTHIGQESDRSVAAPQLPPELSNASAGHATTSAANVHRLLSRGGGYDVVVYAPFVEYITGLLVPALDGRYQSLLREVTGVCHHALFNRRVLLSLISGVETGYQTRFRPAAPVLFPQILRGCPYRPSEYHLYFGYALSERSPLPHLVHDLSFVLGHAWPEPVGDHPFHFAVTHHHFRGPCGPRRGWAIECAHAGGEARHPAAASGGLYCDHEYYPPAARCVGVSLDACARDVRRGFGVADVAGLLARALVNARQERATNILHVAGGCGGPSLWFAEGFALAEQLLVFAGLLFAPRWLASARRRLRGGKTAGEGRCRPCLACTFATCCPFANPPAPPPGKDFPLQLHPQQQQQLLPAAQAGCVKAAASPRRGRWPAGKSFAWFSAFSRGFYTALFSAELFQSGFRLVTLQPPLYAEVMLCLLAAHAFFVLAFAREALLSGGRARLPRLLVGLGLSLCAGHAFYHHLFTPFLLQKLPVMRFQTVAETPFPGYLLRVLPAVFMLPFCWQASSRRDAKAHCSA
ncbi:hypothetical protein DIPPA_10884 [Diplonema papillatum]|nr:hypothetical protein DIPPA_10884 [Diplonema papillatum]|eukprot:gene8067-12406_t